MKSAKSRHHQRRVIDLSDVPVTLVDYKLANRIGTEAFGPHNYIVRPPEGRPGYVIERFDNRASAARLHRIREQHGLETDSNSRYMFFIRQGYNDAEAQQLVYEEKGYL